MAKRKRATKSIRIPVGLKKDVLRKFRSKDKTRLVVVLRKNFSVHSVVANGTTTLIRDFGVPRQTETVIPESVLLPAQRELAIWFARHLAHHGAIPKTRAERSRRKRIMKKVLNTHQSYMETKNVLRAVSGQVKATPAPVFAPFRTFIVVYDPQEKLTGESIFHVHTAGCDRLASDRRRVQKSGGDSWVLEADTVMVAIANQVAEFAEDGKGWEPEDFLIHSCCEDI